MDGVERLKISVIMLTYNRESLIERAIKSIQRQTLQDYEFIIIDNGSTDASGAIAERCARNDPRIRVIHRERGNIGSGRNAGLDAAQGEWIAFIDDDDYAEPDYLEFLLNLATDNGADVSICGTSGKASNERLILNAENSIITLLWRKKYSVGFPAKLIQKTLFKNIRFDEVSKFDDIHLMPNILARAAKTAYHGLGKYIVNRHQNNNSKWTQNHLQISHDILSEYVSVYHKRTDWLCAKFPDNAHIWRYFEWSFMISMVEKVTRLNLQDCYTLRDALVAELQLHRDEFIHGRFALDFEKQWMEAYVE